ncbi:dihydrofolate reductase family protein [Reichenbachiella agarivorans]|uniref:Dihydrofolate reductase family protein n=1 Tax=Reichenbachiella agarivorans TaxID=2979464 RepID=A0ABY6CJM4_9BACT|nr:dihydrofolate reductase family protein [Reichenbachiella agarivorans]UXP30721.1 dihydrofolate reductase family protein [Reichenbachiella agarivorans]
MSERKLILYVSMSLDGYLATDDDDLSWLDMVEREGEDYGYSEFMDRVDTYIVGRKTYDKIIDMVGHLPQAEKMECYVITRQELLPEKNIIFYNDDIEDLIYELKRESGQNIICDGGADVIKLLMSSSLIDEYVISVIPVILGDGKRLFKGGVPSQDIALINSTSFESGLVQLHYVRLNEN